MARTMETDTVFRISQPMQSTLGNVLGWKLVSVLSERIE